MINVSSHIGHRSAKVAGATVCTRGLGMGRGQIWSLSIPIEACQLSLPASISLFRPAFARSHKSKAMLSFSNATNAYDGQDLEDREEHDRWKREYDNPVESSPLARLKRMLGKLLKPGIVGDDAASLSRDAVLQCCSVCRYWPGGVVLPAQLTQRGGSRKSWRKPSLLAVGERGSVGSGMAPTQ